MLHHRGLQAIADGVIAEQQQVADTFFALGLLPKQDFRRGTEAGT
jgi:hypothetical protein